LLKLAAVRNGTRTVRGRWSHLMADSSDELHLFAASLGLKPAWVQKPATVLEHYDVTAGKRALALQLGAIPVTYGEGAHLTCCKRAGIPFDISLLRSDPDRFNAELARARAALDGQDPPPGGPRRLQLQRSAGWRLPPNGVSVAAPTRWANPFRPARRTPAANAAAVERYREYLAANPALLDAARAELAGRDLGCWCPPYVACHADVLLAIVNAPP
jgi:hypothetical protein